MIASRIFIIAFFLLPLSAFGQSWTPVFGPLGDDVEGMRYANGWLFIGTDTAAFTTRVDSIDWQNDSSGMTGDEVFSFLLLPNGILLGGSETNGVFRSSDFGLHWQHSSNGIPDSVTISALDINTAQTIFASVPGHGVYRSTDGGLSWNDSSAGLPNFHCRFLIVARNQDIFCGQTGAISRSTDHGITWTISDAVDTADEVVSLACDSDGNVFAGTVLGAILLTTDNGSSWQKIDSGLARVRTLTSFGPSIFAGTLGMGVVKGSQMDSHWSWTPMNDGLSGDNLSIFSSSVTPDGNLFVGTLGAQVFRANLLGSVVKLPNEEAISVISLTKEGIVVSIPRSEEVRLRIFDVLGRECAILCDGFLTAGTHTFPLTSIATLQGNFFAVMSINSSNYVLPITNAIGY